MDGRASLSVAIITYNEERNIARCLQSVAWADEKIVVDCGSRDRTLEVAARYGARTETRRFTGYVDQKNYAVARATQSWILSLDADEWLPEETVSELCRVLEQPHADVYSLPRRSACFGAFLRRTWLPDRQRRLFRRTTARFVGGRVHESLRPESGRKVGQIEASILHLPYRTMGDYVERLNRYTELAAATLQDRGRKPSRLRLVTRPAATFLKVYLVQRGFRDGVRGWLLAWGSAFYVLLKYAKLWELEKSEDGEFRRLVEPTPEDPDPGAASPGPKSG